MIILRVSFHENLLSMWWSISQTMRYWVFRISAKKYVNCEKMLKQWQPPFSLRIWSIIQIIPKKLWFRHEINLSDIIHYLTCNQWSYACNICKLYPLRYEFGRIHTMTWLIRSRRCLFICIRQLCFFNSINSNNR